MADAPIGFPVERLRYSLHEFEPLKGEQITAQTPTDEEERSSRCNI